jgi:predicted Zn-dependent peptidase
VGSNHEAAKTRGISHFIEHLLFEGTTTRSAFEIASTIESKGGDFGAFTSNTRTAYYIKLLKKHLPLAITILADMLQNPAFKKDIIERERNIVLSELRMRQDEPRSYQWELLQSTMYTKHPAQYPVIGYEKTISTFTKKQFQDFFKATYIPSNIILTLVGNYTPAHLDLLKSTFAKLPSTKATKKLIPKEPLQKANRKKSITKDINHCYLNIGFHAVQKSHKDAPVLDIIDAILGMPLSGRLFRQIRQATSLCYDIGSHFDDETDYGFFAVYLSTQKKNLAKAKSLLLQQIQNVDKITPKEFADVKSYIEGDLLLTMEDTQKYADELAFAQYTNSSLDVATYIKKIKAVTKADITRIKNKYLKYYTETMIQGKHQK